MKMNLLRSIALLFALAFGPNLAQSQEKTEPKKPNQVQPTIMVIPYANKGEDLRTVLEADISRRVALIKVKEGFDSRGFTTVDFVAKLKAAEVDGLFNSDAQSDVKSTMVEYSGADIYVEVEAYAAKAASGNSMRLTLTAYDAFTGNSLANKTEESGQFYTDNFDKLVEKALKKKADEAQPEMLEDFLNVMQGKFTDIVENGRPIKVIFGLKEDSEYDYDTEVNPGNDMLEAVIDDWMSKNAYKGNYHSQGVTKLSLIYDQVRIPLRDEKDKNFSPNRFAQQIVKFCNSLSPTDNAAAKMKAERNVRGGTIYINFK